VNTVAQIPGRIGYGEGGGNLSQLAKILNDIALDIADLWEAGALAGEPRTVPFELEEEE